MCTVPFLTALRNENKKLLHQGTKFELLYAPCCFKRKLIKPSQMGNAKMKFSFQQYHEFDHKILTNILETA